MKFKWFAALLLTVFCFAFAEGKETAKQLTFGDTVDIETPGSEFVQDGNVLYMTFWNRQEKLVAAFDVKNPMAPTLISTFKLGYFPQGLALDRKGKRLFVADGVYLSTLNVADPAKMKLRVRVLVGKDIAAGPVDVEMDRDGTTPLIACRRDGLLRSAERREVVYPAGKDGWMRSILIRDDGAVIGVGTNGVVTAKGVTPIDVGTPRRIRKIGSEYFLANGFAGVVMLDSNAKVICRTQDLNRHASYGSHVFDVVPAGEPGVVLLAAGEIGVLAVAADPVAKTLKYLSDCGELRWGHVNGIHRMGKINGREIIYVCDISYGLRMLDVTDPRNMKLLETGIPLPEQPGKK